MSWRTESGARPHQVYRAPSWSCAEIACRWALMPKKAMDYLERHWEYFDLISAAEARDEIEDNGELVNRAYGCRDPFEAAKGIRMAMAWHCKNVESANTRRLSREAAASPVWREKEIIELIYAEARHRGMHVDHDIPLQGRQVCGLHVHENLRLLTPLQNFIKGNRWSYEPIAV